MSYRVWDKKRKRFINENVYLAPDGELYESSKTIFGQNKLTAVSQDRYVYQKYIDLDDKNGTPIYMGDYLKAQVADDRIVTGVVSYANELSAYVIFCFDVDEYYTLGEYVSQDIQVVGNVFQEFFDK